MNKKEIVSSPFFGELVTEFIKNLPTYATHPNEPLENLIKNFVKDKTESDWIIEEFAFGSSGLKAVRNAVTGHYHTINPQGNRSLAFSTLSAMLTAMTVSGWIISKAKVKSTGKVFAIGDEITCLSEKSHLHKTPSAICSFKLNDSKNIVVHTKLTNYNGLYLGNIVKYERPKYFTEDGKEIKFPGVYFIVDEKFSRSAIGLEATVIDSIKRGKKVFSTSALASDYVAMNAKAFSYNDIIRGLALPQATKNVILGDAKKQLGLG